MGNPLTENKTFPVMFIGITILLMGLYYSLPTSFIENSLVRFFAVVPGSALVDWIFVNTPVHTQHTRIVSPIASLNVLKGCEGTEVLLMLYAAILAMWRPIKWTLLGLVLGTLVVFVLNQVRILTLFSVVASHKDYFELVHGFAAPLVIVVLVSLFFLAWLNWSHQPRVEDQAAE